jgi:hypothetical protein
MKVQIKTINFIFSYLLICLAGSSLFLGPCVAEETLKASSAADTGIALEQVLARIEAKKDEDFKKLVAHLSEQVKQTADKWIAQRSELRRTELNSLVDQNWEKLALTKDNSPLHYDYYLKGYDFSKGQSDILKSDSLTAPYKGRAVVIEKLYVEKYHSPDISSIDPYFFTVTSHITLNVEFNQLAPTVTSIDDKVVSIENEAPEEIKRMRI